MAPQQSGASCLSRGVGPGVLPTDRPILSRRRGRSGFVLGTRCPGPRSGEGNTCSDVGRKVVKVCEKAGGQFQRTGRPRQRLRLTHPSQTLCPLLLLLPSGTRPRSTSASFGKTASHRSSSLAVPRIFHCASDVERLRPDGVDDEGRVGICVVMEDVGRSSNGNIARTITQLKLIPQEQSGRLSCALEGDKVVLRREKKLIKEVDLLALQSQFH
ncbi:unnamed protein product [Vitrella brassicaformis CCMP3155]|uniref:Uncharacterized protein n=1 Tax=Vitrella brassicaformis (strain CCMP3155) TaxID=1169540 RepID=A0A0G4EN52_VITBC|nr:unnamed protein product [Vitrella brassicaformis CCMP3155]|eukprot:CEL98261.1 unnamed protein product [Vitrella brassicaformis CCMP3155]